MDPRTPTPITTPNFAAFGVGSTIAAPYRVTCPECIEIGADVQIAAGSWLSVVDEHLGRRYTPRLVIGDGANIGPDIVVACIGRVEIGARVLTASRVFVGDTYHDYRDPHAAVLDQPMIDPNPVYIGSGSFLGIGSIILPGVTIGEHAYVAAGAVVTTDVPPRTVMAGNPARAIRYWDARREQWVTASQRHSKLPTGSVNNAPATDVEHRAAIAEAELLASSEEVRALELQQGQTLEILEEAGLNRAAAEFWLEHHRRSLSWRLTAPLRAVKRRSREIAKLRR
jgi:acetyltransferase-like isoleucine patch superfamily enzyme